MVKTSSRWHEAGPKDSYAEREFRVTPARRVLGVVGSIISLPSVAINKSAELIGGNLIYDVAIKRVFGSLGINKLASSLFMPIYVRLVREPAAKLEERILGYRTGAITEEGVRSAIIGGIRWAFLLDLFPTLFSGLSRFLGTSAPEQIYRISRSLSMLLGSSDVFKNGLFNLQESVKILARNGLNIQKLSKKEKNILRKTFAMLVSAPFFLWAETVAWPKITHGNELAERINAVLFTDIALFAFVGRAQELAARGHKVGVRNNVPLQEVLRSSSTFQLLEAIEEGITGAFAAQSGFGLYRLGQEILSSTENKSFENSYKPSYIASGEKQAMDFQDGKVDVHKSGVYSNIRYEVEPANNAITKIPNIEGVVKQEGVDSGDKILPQMNGNSLLVDFKDLGHKMLVSDVVVDKIFKDAKIQPRAERHDTDLMSKFFFDVFQHIDKDFWGVVNIDKLLKDVLKASITVKGDKVDVVKRVGTLAPHVNFMIFNVGNNRPQLEFFGNKNDFSKIQLSNGTYSIVPTTRDYQRAISDVLVHDIHESTLVQPGGEHKLSAVGQSDIQVKAQDVVLAEKDTGGDLFKWHDSKGDVFELKEDNGSIRLAVKLAPGQLLLPVVRSGLKELLFEKDPLHARQLIENGVLRLDWLSYMIVAQAKGQVYKVGVDGNIIGLSKEVNNIDDYRKLGWDERYIELNLTNVIIPGQEKLALATGVSGSNSSIGQILKYISQQQANSSNTIGPAISDASSIPIERFNDVFFSTKDYDLSFIFAVNSVKYASNLKSFLQGNSTDVHVLASLGKLINGHAMSGHGYTVFNLASDIRNFGITPEVLDKINRIVERSGSNTDSYEQKLYRNPKEFTRLLIELYNMNFFNNLNKTTAFSGLLSLPNVLNLKVLSLGQVRFYAIELNHGIFFVPVKVNNHAALSDFKLATVFVSLLKDFQKNANANSFNASLTPSVSKWAFLTARTGKDLINRLGQYYDFGRLNISNYIVKFRVEDKNGSIVVFLQDKDNDHSSNGVILKLTTDNKIEVSPYANLTFLNDNDANIFRNSIIKDIRYTDLSSIASFKQPNVRAGYILNISSRDPDVGNVIWIDKDGSMIFQHIPNATGTKTIVMFALHSQYINFWHNLKIKSFDALNFLTNYTNLTAGKTVVQKSSIITGEYRKLLVKFCKNYGLDLSHAFIQIDDNGQLFVRTPDGKNLPIYINGFRVNRIIPNEIAYLFAEKKFRVIPIDSAYSLLLSSDISQDRAVVNKNNLWDITSESFSHLRSDSQNLEIEFNNATRFPDLNEFVSVSNIDIDGVLLNPRMGGKAIAFSGSKVDDLAKDVNPFLDVRKVEGVSYNFLEGKFFAKVGGRLVEITNYNPRLSTFAKLLGFDSTDFNGATGEQNIKAYFNKRILNGVYRQLFNYTSDAVRLDKKTNRIIIFRNGVKLGEFSIVTDFNGYPVVSSEGIFLKDSEGRIWKLFKGKLTEINTGASEIKGFLNLDLFKTGQLISMEGKIIYKNGMPVVLDSNTGGIFYFSGTEYIPARSIKDLLNSGYSLEPDYTLTSNLSKIIFEDSLLNKTIAGLDSTAEADISNSFYLINRWLVNLPSRTFLQAFRVKDGKLIPNILIHKNGKYLALRYSDKVLLDNDNMFPVFNANNGDKYIIRGNNVVNISSSNSNIVTATTAFQRKGFNLAKHNNSFMVDTITGLPVLVRDGRVFVLKADGLKQVYANFNIAFKNGYIQDITSYKREYMQDLDVDRNVSFIDQLKAAIDNLSFDKMLNKFIGQNIDLLSRVDDIVFDKTSLGHSLVDYTLEQARTFPSNKFVQTLLAQEEWDKFVKGKENITFKIILNIIRSGGHRGGSTLVQQVVKSFMPELFRTRGLGKMQLIRRKLLEVFLAQKLSYRVPADAIIRAASNVIHFGKIGGVSINGANQAAWVFLGKDPSTLTYAESALLVSTINAPYKDGLLSLFNAHSRSDFQRVVFMANGDLYKLYQRGVLGQKEYEVSLREIYEILYGKPIDEYNYVAGLGVVPKEKLNTLFSEYLSTSGLIKETITTRSRLLGILGSAKVTTDYKYKDFLTFLMDKGVLRDSSFIDMYFSNRAKELTNSFKQRVAFLNNNHGGSDFTVADMPYKNDLEKWVEFHVSDKYDFNNRLNKWLTKYKSETDRSVSTYSDLRNFLAWLSSKDTEGARSLSVDLYSFLGDNMVKTSSNGFSLDPYPFILAQENSGTNALMSDRGIGIVDSKLLHYYIQDGLAIGRNAFHGYNIGVVKENIASIPLTVMRDNNGHSLFVKPLNELGDNVYLDIESSKVFRNDGNKLTRLGWFIKLNKGGVIIKDENLFSNIDLDKIDLAGLDSVIAQNDKISMRLGLSQRRLLNSFDIEHLDSVIFVPLSVFPSSGNQNVLDLVTSKDKILQSAFRVVGSVEIDGKDMSIIQYIGNHKLAIVSTQWLKHSVEDSNLVGLDFKRAGHLAATVSNINLDKEILRLLVQKKIQEKGLDFFFVENESSPRSDVLQQAVNSFFDKDNAYVAFGSDIVGNNTGNDGIYLIAGTKNIDRQITPGSIAKVFTEAVATSLGIQWAPGGRSGTVCLEGGCVKIYNWTEQEYVSSAARKVLEARNLSPAEVLAYSNNVGAAWDWAQALKELYKNGVDVTELFTSNGPSKFAFDAGVLGSHIGLGPNTGTTADLVFAGFGQGSFHVDAFPILAMMATIANGGKSMPVYIDSFQVGKVTKSFDLTDYTRRELHRGLQMAVSAKHGTATYAVGDVPYKLNRALAQAHSPWVVDDFFGKTATAEIGGGKYNKGFAGAIVFKNLSTGKKMILPFTIYQLGVDASAPHTPELFKDFVDKKLIPLIREDPTLAFLKPKEGYKLQVPKQLADVSNNGNTEKTDSTHTNDVTNDKSSSESLPHTQWTIKIPDKSYVFKFLDPTVLDMYSRIPDSQKLQCVAGLFIGPWLLPENIRSKIKDSSLRGVRDVEYLISTMGASASGLINRVVGGNKNFNIVGRFGISGMSLDYLRTDSGYSRFINSITNKPVVGVRDKGVGDKWGHAFLIENYDDNNIIFIDLNRGGTGYKSDNTLRYKIVPKSNKQAIISTIQEFAGANDGKRVWLFIHGEFPKLVALNN